MCSGKKNKAVGVDFYNLDITGKVVQTHTAGRNDNHHIPCVVTFEPGIASRDGGHVKVAQPVTATYGMGGNNQPLVICLQGNGIDRADTAGCNGKGWTEDVSYTLNTIDRHAVAYKEKRDVTCVSVHGDIAGTLDASYYKGCGERNGVERDVVAVAYRANAYDELEQTEKGATLKACGGNYGGV